MHLIYTQQNWEMKYIPRRRNKRENCFLILRKSAKEQIK